MGEFSPGENADYFWDFRKPAGLRAELWRDAALADQFRRASLRVQGMDSGLALRALLASGDEDRIVDAAREMTGAQLFELCRRWMENGRRPSDPKKRAAVERAVAALKDQPRIDVEPAPPLPAGMVDLFDTWTAAKLSDDELRRDLQAPDPMLRARALHLGAGRGIVDPALLGEKAKGEDWPERLVAALHGAHPGAAGDHVYWVASCAGLDEGAHAAAVACGPEEFELTQSLLARLRATATPLAKRSAAELEALQAFRALDTTMITVTADDSATVRGAVEKRGEVSREEMDQIFRRGTGRSAQ